MTDDPRPEGTVQPLLKDEDVDAAIASAPAVVLFKHSPLCGTSSRALRQVARFAAERPETPVFMVDVVENRDVSRYITEKFGIRHQSPQVIVTHDGAPTWNGSHFRVSMRAIRREVDRT